MFNLLCKLGLHKKRSYQRTDFSYIGVKQECLICKKIRRVGFSIRMNMFGNNTMDKFKTNWK